MYTNVDKNNSYFECCRSTAILTDSLVRAALEVEQKKRIQKKPPVPKKRLLTIKNTAPTASQNKDEECLVCGETFNSSLPGEVWVQCLFASSGHMRHALRVQNILSVTTVTMSRQMPFVMFLFVCTVYLLTPVNISQVSIQMDLFLLPDSSGSHSVVSNFSTYMPLFFKGSV